MELICQVSGERLDRCCCDACVPPLRCVQCGNGINECRCAAVLSVDSYDLMASGAASHLYVKSLNPYTSSPTACGTASNLYGWGQKDTSDESRPNISTPEIDALYPKPDPVTELSEQEKERIWETLKQAARG